MSYGISDDPKSLRKGRVVGVGIHDCYAYFGTIVSKRKGVLTIEDDWGDIHEIQIEDICTFFTDDFDNDEIRSFKWHWDRYQCDANW